MGCSSLCLYAYKKQNLVQMAFLLSFVKFVMHYSSVHVVALTLCAYRCDIVIISQVQCNKRHLTQDCHPGLELFVCATHYHDLTLCAYVCESAFE